MKSERAHIMAVGILVAAFLWLCFVQGQHNLHANLCAQHSPNVENCT